MSGSVFSCSSSFLPETTTFAWGALDHARRLLDVALPRRGVAEQCLVRQPDPNLAGPARDLRWRRPVCDGALILLADRAVALAVGTHPVGERARRLVTDAATASENLVGPAVGLPVERLWRVELAAHGGALGGSELPLLHPSPDALAWCG